MEKDSLCTERSSQVRPQMHLYGEASDGMFIQQGVEVYMGTAKKLST